MRVALIGRNINHSMSPKVYLDLSQGKIQCDLLDFQDLSEIPSLKTIFKEYSGVSITSPYKRHFLNEVKQLNDQLDLQAINCIYQEKEMFYGVNTDYLAMISIFNDSYLNSNFERIIILGDGVMSHVCAKVLDRFNLAYEIVSRRNNLNFSKIDYSSNEKKLLINSCAREFIFKNKVDQNTFFWDLNYGHSLNRESLIKQQANYVDGEELLIKQALLNLSFWSANG